MKMAFSQTTQRLGYLLIPVILLTSACGGGSGVKDTDLPTEDSLAPTALTGVGDGLDEEPTDPEDQEISNDEEDIPPVPIDICNINDPDFMFEFSFDHLVWLGPPRIEVGHGGYISQLGYTYDPDTLMGSFFVPGSSVGQRPVSITVIWPECSTKNFRETTSFTPTVTGSCKGNQITLQAAEVWESVSIDITCDAGSKLCSGDEPCQVPIPLPFALAGEKGVTLNYTLYGDGTCQPEKTSLPFMGVNAEGMKTFRMVCNAGY
jgi:hypothetical protein